MLLVSIVLEIILIVLIIKYLWNRRKFYYLSWKLNSMMGLPFFGVILKMRKQEDILHFIDNTRSKFFPRDGIVWFGPNPIFYVSEPHIVKKILTSTACVKKLEYYDIFTKNFGAGIISTNPPIWTHHRKLIDPSFNIKVLKSFFNNFNTEVDILMNRFSKYIGNGTFDILSLFQMCTMDITTQTTMGVKLHLQLEQNLELVKAFQSIAEITIVRIFNPFYHIDFIFNLTKWSKKLRESQVYIRNFIKNVIEEKLQQDPDSIEDNDKNNNFISTILSLLRTEQFTMEDAINEATDIILGGYDTTANTCSYTIMCLAMFPEYQEKVYEELCHHFPDKNNIYIQEEDIVKLKYLDQVINENMRLMSPIPLAGRMTTEEFPIDEYDIVLPKNAQILIDIFHMHRDENTWGSKSKTFYPDHFSPEESSNRHPFAFIPFTKGHRTCIGFRYAHLSLRTILAKVLRKYKFTTKFKFENLHFVENVMLKLKEVPLLEIHEREI